VWGARRAWWVVWLKSFRGQGHRQSRVVVITSFLVRWSDAEEVEDLV
jgi:hypothetical protein